VTPLVTVVIPARDAQDTIRATISSILGQDAGAPVVVVVDDASADRTAEAAADVDPARVRVLRGRGAGPGAARNLGVVAASTPYLAFCDADDTWPASRLRADLALLATEPATAAVLGRTRFDADSPDLLEGMVFDDDDRTALIPHFGAVTLRTEAFHRVGPIAEDLANYEDYEWFLRVREHHVPLVAVDRISLYRRIHESSTSRRNPPSPTDLLGMLQRSVRRRARVDGSRDLPTLTALRKDPSP
jgi:glycosyltransferase involved in cell wall biosynthesis